MVAFSNPVQGLIRPPGSPVIVGSFRVTSTFTEHVASGRGAGIDIGNAQCGSPVLAMKAGRISLVYPGKVGSTASADASIVRVDHGVLDDGARYENGVAHLRIRAGLAVDQIVPEGYQLGTIDKVGTSACHLHGGMRRNGVEIDWWQLLIQNGAQEDGMIPVPSVAFTELVNKKTSLISVADFHAERLLSAPVLKRFPAGTNFIPVGSANEGSPAGGPTPTLWYFGFMPIAGGVIGGWFHSSGLGPLVANEPAIVGYTQDDLDEAKRDEAARIKQAAETAATKAIRAI